MSPKMAHRCPTTAIICFISPSREAATKPKFLCWASNATAVDGQRWSVVGDVFFVAPRRVDNLLFVPPSPADKRALLDSLLTVLK